jgi:hypothetical protein
MAFVFGYPWLAAVFDDKFVPNNDDGFVFSLMNAGQKLI